MRWQTVTDIDHLWPPPPVDLALTGDEVHVWRAFLDRPAVRVQGLQRTLAPDELERAGQFNFPKDRQRFIVARGLLRVILSRYLDVRPGQLRFCYGDYGKPRLAPAAGLEMLSFNLSHADGLALFAVARGREVGVDLEPLRAISEADQIAARFFSAQENAVLRTLSAALKQEAFFHCWTRKEAYVKARGEGLSLTLDQFDVSIIPGQPALLLSASGCPQEPFRWSLREVRPGPGYVAALAVEGHDWQLACWQFPDGHTLSSAGLHRRPL